jgi:hypothetical protein
MRMAASADGRRIAFGWITFDRAAPGLPVRTNAISVWQVNPNQQLWSAPFSTTAPSPLPDPATDFPEMAKNFRLAADEIVPGHVASSIALNQDGSGVAVVEYAVQGWVRHQPAIGKWNPPIHALNFLPRQRGRLRVFDGNGMELLSESLPAEGMYEVGFGGENTVWCWPSAWFARGMAGEPWLPMDRPSRTLYRVGLDQRTMTACDFPDAIADCAVSSTTGGALVSCWDGRVYLLEPTGKLSATLDADGPARLVWSNDGTFALAGTAAGRLMRLDSRGKLDWIRSIPVTEPPPLTKPPEEVVVGLPVFQGGRIPRGEHA